jgi:anti-sigma B factor antagonist
MDFSVSAREGDLQSVVRVAGELDLVTARPLEQFLAEVLSAGSGWLVVDLALVTFMDCAGLSVMLRAHEASLRRGGGLCLVAVPGRVRALLALTGTQCLAAPSLRPLR